MSSWGNETIQATIGLPEPCATEISNPHWQACKEQRLLVQQCTGCQSYTFPPEKNCPQCFENTLVWQQSSGKGKIYSFTVVYRPQTPAFKTPYVAAIIELDEGWHMLSNIIECDIDKLAVNQPVAVCFEERGNSVLPMFRTVKSNNPKQRIHY